MRQPRGKTALLEGFTMEAGTEAPNRGGTESEGRTFFFLPWYTRIAKHPQGGVYGERSRKLRSWHWQLSLSL